VLGLRWTVSSVLEAIANATFGALFLVFLWFILCWIVRRRWIAAIVLYAAKLALGGRALFPEAQQAA
jgi:hypothetical protein